jgi:radical SAM-linked protein
MAYSSGFSPHPRISYANASPTGAASEAEYLEIGLAQQCDPDRVKDALDAALPPGLDVLEVVAAPTGALADLLTGSRWKVQVVGVDADVLQRAVATFLDRESVEVQRLTKNGMRSFDARQAVVFLASSPARLDLVTKHQEPLVRPDDVLSGLGLVDEEFRPSEVPILTRISQGVLDPSSGEISDPFRH